MDILAIRLAYSNKGSKRKDTSTIWRRYAVEDWNNSFLDSTNYKHADCNGDGVVNYKDTSVVTKNYTKSQFRQHKVNIGKNTDPLLRVDIQNDSLKAGDTLVAYIILGENALPAKDVYDIAFSLSYNKHYFSSINEITRETG